MNKFLHLIAFLLVTVSCLGQSNSLSNENLSVDYTSKNKTEKTLIINTTDYSILTFESLKEEFISWKEKVKSVEINELNRQFILVHNSALENRELYDVLNKYNIAKNAIISYK